MAEDQVQGISLGLTLDPSGFSSGIARAKADLAGLKRAAENITIGVNARAPRQASNVLGPQAVLPGGAPAAPRVSPHFQVSAGAVRDLRTDINQQLRQFAAQGEGIAIPIRLGRVPYAAMRSEIATGIGEVPIKVSLDPRSIAIAIQQLSTGIVTGTAATVGIPRRATGGAVEANRPIIVGERRAEVFTPTTNGRILPAATGRYAHVRASEMTPGQRAYGRNLGRAARSLTPEQVDFGRLWYRNARGWIEEQAQTYGIPVEQARGITAALSAGTAWTSNKTKASVVFQAIRDGKPFPYGMGLNAHATAKRIFDGESPTAVLGHMPKVGQFDRNLAGDFNALTLDRWALRTATQGAVSEIKAGRMRTSIEKAYRRAAKSAGLDPAEFQAALWGQEKQSVDPGPLGRFLAKGGPVGGLRRLLSQGAERYGARAQSSYGARFEGFLGAFGGNIFGRGANARGMLGKAGRSEGRGESVDLMGALEDFAANPSAPREPGLSQLGRLKGMFQPGDQPGMPDLTQHMFRWLEMARSPGAQSLLGRSIKTSAGVQGSNERILKTLAHLPDKPNIVPFTRPWSPIPVAWSRGGRGDLPTGMAGGLGMTGLPHERRPSSTDPRLQPGEDLMLDPHNGVGGRFADFVPGALGEFGRNARGGFVGRWSGGRAEAYRRTIEQGGGTFDPMGNAPSKGYAVGLAQGTAAMVGQDDRLGFIRGFRQQRKAGAPFVGTWLNEGNIHIDPVDVLRRKREAIRLGVGNQQEAIYDLLRGEEISTRRRYRGGPALSSVFPGGVDLSLFEREDRLAIGKALYSAGREFPFTAQRLAGVQGLNLYDFAKKHGVHDTTYTAGITSGKPAYSLMGKMVGIGAPTIDLNPHGISTGAIREMGALPNSWADVATHEFGHAVDYAHGFVSGQYDTAGAPLSGSSYASQNVREKFAELFLHSRRGGDTSGLMEAAQDLDTERMGVLRRLWGEGVTRKRFMESVVRLKSDPTRAAGGDQSRSGMYIVNELAEEKFVPRSREGDIPREVASRIPGGHMIGRGRGRGQIQTIRGRNRLWSAPEDGWIIPGHLTQKVPQRQAGGPSFGGGGFDSDEFRAEQAARGREQSEQERIRRNEELKTRQAVRAAALRSRQLRDQVFDLPGSNDLDPSIAARAEAQAANAAIRGLTGRASLGGLFGSLLGGGRERRLAAAEASALTSQISRFAPRGVEPIAHRREVLAEAEAELTASEKLRDSHAKNTAAYSQLNKVVEQNRRTVGAAADAFVKVSDLSIQRERALSAASGGAIKNFAAVTGAGFAFNAGMQALNLGLELTEKTLAPVIDQLSGFTATNQRVSSGLAGRLPQAGTLGTLFGQVGIEAGLSRGNADFLEQALGGGVLAKAGASRAGIAGDLFKAAFGGGAPQGLIGGFGGIGGGGLFAQQLGGGTGLLETIASTVAATRGQPESPGPIGDLSSGVGVIGRAFTNAIGSALDPTYVQQSLLNPIIAVTEEQQSVAAETIDYVNEAIARGRTSLGGGAGARLVDVGAGSPDAARVLATQGLDDYTRQLAEAGVVFKTATGDLITTQRGIIEATGDISRGLALPDKETFMKAQEQGLRAQFGAAGAREQLQREVNIPGALGQQLAAQPFMDAFAGIADASLVTLTNLEDVQRLQAETTQQGEEGVRKQAQFIAEQVGPGAGMQFTGLMDQVSAYGEEIQNLNATIANRQALLSAAQYANSLRIINRQIAEARGLAGQSGGNRLGQLERQQFMLGRAAEALQLAAQELQIALTQRQINFQRAIAGFQAPGITGEERAARMEEARVEAAFAQQALDIQKRQLGIGQQQFGIGGEVFALQTAQAVVDLEAQKVINAQSYALEQEQIAAQKRIAVLSVRQGQLQAEAQSLFAQATNNFDARLAVASAYAAQFGGTMAGAIRIVNREIDNLIESRGGGGGGGQGRKQLQTGYVGLASQPTDVTFGEAGNEFVAVIRNPRRPMGGGGMGFGGGGGMNVQVNVDIHDMVVRDESDIDRIARRVAERVEESLGTKAGMLSG